MDYAQVVTDLDSAEPPVPVWCLAGELDAPSYRACTQASGNHYQSQLYAAKDEHGMMLVDPKIEPNPLDLFLDFLALFFEF